MCKVNKITFYICLQLIKNNSLLNCQMKNTCYTFETNTAIIEK